MPRHTLYAYVDGADLEDVADTLDARFTEFVVSRWVAGRASVINQRYGEETCTQPGELPFWDFGLNLELPDVGTKPPDCSLTLRLSHDSSGRCTVTSVVISLSVSQTP